MLLSRGSRQIRPALDWEATLSNSAPAWRSRQGKTALALIGGGLADLPGSGAAQGDLDDRGDLERNTP
jgi:hypothetical protein